MSHKSHRQNARSPNHVAIIMDGNGRWATSQGKTRFAGHRAGTIHINDIVRAFVEHGVKYLTIFAFSTENWGRHKREVDALISLIHSAVLEQTETLHEQGVKINHIGRLDRLPINIQSAIENSINMTKYNATLTLTIAFDYGGRADILNAVKSVVNNQIESESITESIFSQHLSTSDLPDPDLVIRTAGEMRLSNFLLWESAYAEYYSTKVMWPDFGHVEVNHAIAAYAKRVRRFGELT